MIFQKGFNRFLMVNATRNKRVSIAWLWLDPWLHTEAWTASISAKGTRLFYFENVELLLSFF
jgi:hypothetical protein